MRANYKNSREFCENNYYWKFIIYYKYLLLLHLTISLNYYCYNKKSTYTLSRKKYKEKSTRNLSRWTIVNFHTTELCLKKMYKITKKNLFISEPRRKLYDLRNHNFMNYNLWSVILKVYDVEIIYKNKIHVLVNI